MFPELMFFLGLLSPPGGGRSRQNLQELGAQNLLQVTPTAPGQPGASVWLGAQWFKQTLDHFKRGDNGDTFDQKYFVDDTHYDGSGPIILYINGEAPLYSAPGGSSFTGYMAQQMKAMIVALEHRFYGDSHPFSDMSTSSLRYLNSAQALLDLRKFRLTYDQQLGPRPDGTPHKWVVVGGSYAGSLAAWSRLRFPHLFAAAHASSAPIEAIDTFTRFDLQLQQSLPSGCQDMVRQVNQLIDERLGPVNGTGGEAATAVKRLFDAEALSNDDFSYLIADSVAIAVQYGQKGKLCDRLNQAALEGAGPTSWSRLSPRTRSVFFTPRSRQESLRRMTRFTCSGLRSQPRRTRGSGCGSSAPSLDGSRLSPLSKPLARRCGSSASTGSIFRRCARALLDCGL